MSTLAADVFWSFRSPYSFIAARRYRALAGEYDLTINLRPVYPLAIRQPDFFEKNHPNWLSYTLRDFVRVAQHLGIQVGPPRPDPIVQDIATRAIAAEQPYIYRITRLGQAAARRGRGLEFADEASRLIFGGVENWHEGDHLAGAAGRAGLDFVEIETEAAADAEALDAEIAGNQAALEAAGHWGVPTLVFEGEPFFGQDRIDLAVWRMQQAGLAPRAASKPKPSAKDSPLKLDPIAPETDESTLAALFSRGLGDPKRAREIARDTLGALRSPPWGSYVALSGDEVVGSCAFKTGRDSADAVEIVYMTFPGFARRGFATAMARELVKIASNGGAKSVLAHTLPDIGPSTLALARNDFALVGEVFSPEEGLLWRWERKLT